MGTTLQNGVYLPNEGERNCYAGLKTNWEILDQKVADVTALQQAIAGALHREIVATLPTTDIDTATIYMILNGTSATENIYNEYMYISNAWELIGTSATDLTNYYTKAEVDGKLLLKASASDLTSHTGDTTIHVTASDKAKWNTVALIKHLRLVNAQVGSATTIAFANIDDTNGIKVGDKCMDLDAKMFEITAVDTTNQTVTVGSALIDIALDTNVVHTSGNKTVGGKKELSEITTFAGSSLGNEGSNNARTCMYSYCNRDTKDYSGIYQRRVRQNREQGSMSGSDISQYAFDVLENQVRTNNVLYFVARDFVDDVPQTVYLTSQCTNRTLGSSNYAWSAVYSDTYYYGNIEFSNKFVTTDTVQDIAGNKNFKGLITTTPDATLWPATTNTTADITGLGDTAIHIEYKTSGKLTDLSGGAWGVAELGTGCLFFRFNNGTDIRYKHFPTNTVNRIPVVSNANRQLNSLTPETDNTYNLGDSTRRWKTINNINPGALSFPDLSAGVDISSYITDLTGASNVNKYTPTVDGWISIGIPDAEFIELYVPTLLMGGTFTKSTANNNAQAFMPVVANKEVKIALKGSTVGWAKFFPCLGNV